MIDEKVSFVWQRNGSDERMERRSHVKTQGLAGIEGLAGAAGLCPFGGGDGRGDLLRSSRLIEHAINKCTNQHGDF